jgi:hypothetical protein
MKKLLLLPDDIIFLEFNGGVYRQISIHSYLDLWGCVVVGHTK